MSLGQTEETQDLLSGRASALTLLRVQREFLDLLAFHSQTQLALDEGADEECEKVQREERLDAPLVLEKHRSNFVHGLDLLEALLDHRLALVSLKNLGR